MSNPLDQATYIFLSLCLFPSMTRILSAQEMGLWEQEIGMSGKRLSERHKSSLGKAIRGVEGQPLTAEFSL